MPARGLSNLSQAGSIAGWSIIVNWPSADLDTAFVGIESYLRVTLDITHECLVRDAIPGHYLVCLPKQLKQ